MTTINTNTSASIAANSLKQNDRLMNDAMERLSTGKRINNAGDDAAGLAITSRMTTHIDGLEQAARNANDAIGMIQVADGALEEMTGILQRMREIAVQASSATYTTSDIGMIAKEFTQLRDEVSNIVSYTTWNGTALLDGQVDSSNVAATDKAVDDLVITQATLRALNTANDSIILTDSDGTTITINNAAVAATAAGSYADATLANLATAINTAIDANAAFDGMLAAEGGNGITFTQDTAGTGQIVKINKDTSGTDQGALGAVTRTTHDGADTVSFQIGMNVNQTLSVDFGTLKMTAATGGDLGVNFTTGLTISTNADANTAMGYVDTAIDAVNTRRATLGAAISRLEHTVDNLENNAVNHSASRSRILDADYAAETTELARTQIIQQAGTAMLSQANQKAQAVLKLLQN
ncbi:MAG: flagellin [Porticoccaceae bacterium]